jgi:hypothetical protein
LDKRKSFCSVQCSAGSSVHDGRGHRGVNEFRISYNIKEPANMQLGSHAYTNTLAALPLACATKRVIR